MGTKPSLSQQAGKIEEKLFAETRLRRGAYGQRYDNGQRHDGIDTRKLQYPSELTKGPDTLWDAPGMHRIKIPFGAMTAEQMEVLAALSEEYSDAICHVTTRQDIQLHFVHIDDTPDLMRRLAAVGITTREACGNSVRNVTACPIAGVCNDEGFDITPYAKALTFFLLGHPDVQDFGRKFKIAFSGCAQHACALTTIHDMGFIAQTRGADGKRERGFKVVVGGGLGAVPYQAETLYEFLPEAEIMPVSQAVSRVFARLGEKQNRARARIKFLVAKLGIDELRRLVDEERGKLREDPRWQGYLEQAHALRRAAQGGPAARRRALPCGLRSMAAQQRAAAAPARLRGRDGQAAARRRHRGPDARPCADVAEVHARDRAHDRRAEPGLPLGERRATCPALYSALDEHRLGEPGASTILDVVACPGTDTCKPRHCLLARAGARSAARLSAKFFTMARR